MTPDQKRRLVQALKRKDHTVAMTGDGVNDILAMKSADCSIAMASGSDAATQVAQVVLLDSDFGHMTQVVTEGRRVVNNVQRSAILFLVKISFQSSWQLSQQSLSSPIPYKLHNFHLSVYSPLGFRDSYSL